MPPSKSQFERLKGKDDDSDDDAATTKGKKRCGPALATPVCPPPMLTPHD